MKGSKELLSSVIKTTQMGQTGIHSVLKSPLNASLRAALQSQLMEYDSIEQEAQAIAQSRGWTLEELDPAVKGMSGMVTRMQLRFGDTDYKAISMTIQGNTRGDDQGTSRAAQISPFRRPGHQAFSKAFGLRDRQHPANAGISLSAQIIGVYRADTRNAK